MSWSLLKVHLLAVASAYAVALVILSVHLGADGGDGGAVAFFVFWGFVFGMAMVPILALLTLPMTLLVMWGFERLSVTQPAAFLVAGAAIGVGSLFLLQLGAVVVYGARSGDFDWRRLADVDWVTTSSLMPAGAVGGWLIWRARCAGRSA